MLNNSRARYKMLVLRVQEHSSTFSGWQLLIRTNFALIYVRKETGYYDFTLLTGLDLPRHNAGDRNKGRLKPLILSRQPKRDNRLDTTNHGTDTRTIRFIVLLSYAWFTEVISYVLAYYA